MKKLSFLILSLFLILSCTSVDNSNNKTEIERGILPSIEYDQVIYELTTSSGYSYKEQVFIKKFSYEGHNYLLMRQGGPQGMGGLVHDPNCKTCKKD